MMKPNGERDQLRREIMDYGRKLMLSKQVIELCGTETTPRQEEFLHRVLSEKIASRERSRKSRLLNRAGFPLFKSFDGYDPEFTEP